MKRWIIFCAVTVAVGVFTRLKPAGVDIAALEPVEVMYVDSQNGSYCLFTDTDQQGCGKTADQAISRLKASASGEIYLETAQYLLLSPAAWESVERFAKYLRPDCAIALTVGLPDMETAAQFLNTHKPGYTVTDLQAGDRKVPVLYCQEGRMRLERP